MTGPRPKHMITVACWLGLAALSLMVWSVLDPRPVPVFLAMSVGQAIGTASLAMFLFGLLRGVPKRAPRI